MATTSINCALGTERERANETSFSEALRLMNIIISSSRAKEFLNHVHAHMDHGHWVHKVLYFFLGGRAVTRGIVKRTAWFPFAYGKKNQR